MKKIKKHEMRKSLIFKKKNKRKMQKYPYNQNYYYNYDHNLYHRELDIRVSILSVSVSSRHLHLSPITTIMSQPFLASNRCNSGQKMTSKEKFFFVQNNVECNRHEEHTATGNAQACPWLSENLRMHTLEKSGLPKSDVGSNSMTPNEGTAKKITS